MSHAFRQQLANIGMRPTSNEPSPIHVYYPHIPLSATGLPPGPDFVANAAAYLGGDGEEPDSAALSSCCDYYYYRALYDDNFTLPLDFEGRLRPTRFMLGGIWGALPTGPRMADVMLVVKAPSFEDTREYRYLSGDAENILRTALYDQGIEDTSGWYVTAAVRHTHLSPSGGQMASAWKKNCAPLLQMELMIVRPRILVVVGADAAKAVLGKSTTMKSLQDRVVPFSFTLLDGTQHTCQVLAIPDVNGLVRQPENLPVLETAISHLANVLEGVAIVDVEPGVTHLKVTTETQLTKLVDAILANPDWHTIAVDAEWHKAFPSEPGAYLRTVQISWTPKAGAAIVLNAPGGTPCFEGGIEAAAAQLRRLFDGKNKIRAVGHYLIADIPWLRSIGVDLLPHYYAASTPEATKTEGGWDTMVAAHSCEETVSFKLEDLSGRFLRTPRHDVRLQEWRVEYCKAMGISDSDLEGYGDCSDDILVGIPTGQMTDFGELVTKSYGIYDVDTCRRLMDLQNGTPGQIGMLDCDAYGNSSRAAFHRTLRAMPAYEEMHSAGIRLNIAEIHRLQGEYLKLRDVIYGSLRATINWPTFNADSNVQCVELLHGEMYNKKRDKITGERVRVRPPEAISLGLLPHKTTGKKSKLWADVLAQGHQDRYTPSVDKETLTILADHPDPEEHARRLPIRLLRDLRTVSQVLKQVLQPPKAVGKSKTKVAAESTQTEESTDVEESAAVEEEFEQTGGVLKFVHQDSRIRPQFFPTKDTGRTSCARPAMQNWSKSAEDKYKACFETYGVGAGLQYPGPIRASLEASEGCVLVDPDFTGAEMAIAAFACQDPNMLECIRRNSLPEDHPDYLDIHSMVAVRAFKLDCEWSKKALKAIGKAHLRTPAKRVGFGKLYGQTPASMARKIREDKVAITDEEAAAVDSAIDEMWPGLPQYMNECRQRAADPGWMQNCYGRSRRRPRGFVSNVALRDLERKFMNFGMQSAVADAMKVTLGNLIWYRAAYRQAHPESPHTFRILLEIHDQLVLETPTGSLDWMIDEVLPLCMSKLVPIRPRRLDGTLIDAGPYYLSVPQPDVYTQWTVPLKPVDCERLGISSRYAKESS